MRHTALALPAILLLAACGRDGGAPAPAEESNAEAPKEIADVFASDSLPGLAAAPTGIDFWSHPTLTFNGMMIVATSNGVTGYSIEDGVEAATIAGVDAQGVAVSYLGVGPQARGLLVYFDNEASAFAVNTIDNASRNFQRIEGDIPIRGNVRGYCFGRALNDETSALHIVQKGKLTTYEFSAEDSVVKAEAGISAETPDNLVSCAVDGEDGAVFLASDSGDIYRFDIEIGFEAPFASSAAVNPGGMTVLLSKAEEGAPSVNGQIALLDQDNGAVHLFDREDGHALGAVRISATDELEGVSAATSLGVTGANMGGLYRSGVVALGVEGEAPSVRLIPAGGVFNALSLETGEPVDPRGTIVTEDDNNGLLIETGFTPE